MEVEFDKEIDAILRKSRGEYGRPDPTEGHIDADAAAAFAENAVPMAIRSNYVRHLADCDRCRGIVASAMIPDEASETAVAAAVPLVGPALLPWYQRLLRGPSLALGMACVLLLLVGGVGYLMLRDNGNTGASISQMTEQPARRGGPYGDSETSSSSANAATATANSTGAGGLANAASSNRIGNAGAAPTVSSSNAQTGNPADKESSDDTATRNPTGSTTPDGANEITTRKAQPTTLAAPAPPPATETQQPAAAAGKSAPVDETKQRDQTSTGAGVVSDDKKDKDKTVVARRGMITDRLSVNGPLRRSVAGKTFDQKEGVWYDAAYHGQATKNVRRGGDDFKKLDEGLRSIANGLNGVVVVVWKGVAYRIQ